MTSTGSSWLDPPKIASLGCDRMTEERRRWDVFVPSKRECVCERVKVDENFTLAKNAITSNGFIESMIDRHFILSSFLLFLLSKTPLLDRSQIHPMLVSRTCQFSIRLRRNYRSVPADKTEKYINVCVFLRCTEHLESSVQFVLIFSISFQQRNLAPPSRDIHIPAWGVDVWTTSLSGWSCSWSPFNKCPAAFRKRN